MAEAPEKRSTRRFALRLPVSVSYADEQGNEKSAETRDVSARGICFYLDSAIATGSAIELFLPCLRNHLDRKHTSSLQGQSGSGKRRRPRGESRGCGGDRGIRVPPRIVAHLESKSVSPRVPAFRLFSAIDRVVLFTQRTSFHLL